MISQIKPSLKRIILTSNKLYQISLVLETSGTFVIQETQYSHKSKKHHIAYIRNSEKILQHGNVNIESTFNIKLDIYKMQDSIQYNLFMHFQSIELDGYSIAYYTNSERYYVLAYEKKCSQQTIRSTLSIKMVVVDEREYDLFLATNLRVIYCLIFIQN